MGAQCDTNTPPPDTSLAIGTLRASISTDGTFTSTEATAAHNGSNIVVHGQVVDNNVTRSIELIFPDQTTVPVSLTVADGVVIDYATQAGILQPKEFYADGTQGSGTITITKLTSTAVEGSFSGTLRTNPPGAETDRLVADGQFNASF